MATDMMVDREAFQRWIESRTLAQVVDKLSDCLECGIAEAEDGCGTVQEAAEYLDNEVIVPAIKRYVFTVELNCHPDEAGTVESYFDSQLERDLDEYDSDIKPNYVRCITYEEVGL